jgi:hypothetical protein
MQRFSKPPPTRMALTDQTLVARGASFGKVRQGEMFCLCDGKDPDGNSIQLVRPLKRKLGHYRAILSGKVRFSGVIRCQRHTHGFFSRERNSLHLNRIATVFVRKWQRPILRHRYG